ncbi:helix-turn-helix domain-containing protein [Kitasatospora sp. NPDC093558]|uniref:helix-turn-helix domain-containing protein n=1 Tax=Kitasatospora sp. NPDC093558 TaxID=3155201 RepID=UPI00343AF0BF
MLDLEDRRRHRRPAAADALPAPGDAQVGSVQIVRGHAEELKGTTEQHSFGEVRVCLVSGGPHELVRPQRLIEPDQPGRLRICRLLEGEVQVFQDGRYGTASGSQLICFDSTRPYKVVMPRPFRMVEVMVTHRLMGVTPAEARQLTGKTWSGEKGIGALTSGLLDGLEQHGSQVDTAIELLGGSVAGLVAALFAERMSALAEGSASGRQALMLYIQGYIKERLADPELSPVTVARRHNVSLRYLQKLFQEHGTSPARLIRDQRLARCRAELADPGLDHLPVSVIGERSGLYGASHFSRLFRDRYGIAPRDVRKARAAARHPDPIHPQTPAAPARSTP